MKIRLLLCISVLAISSSCEGFDPNAYVPGLYTSTPAPASSASLDDAASFIIPTGNRKGQVLGDQTLNVIEWYAKSLKPANADQEKLQANALLLLKVRSNGHAPVAA